MGTGTLTYCAISGLGLIPVVWGEMAKSTEDILFGHACQTGCRVGPGDEGGGGRGHGGVGGTGGDGGEVGLETGWL